MKKFSIAFVIFCSALNPALGANRANPWALGSDLHYQISGANDVSGTMHAFVRENQQENVWMEQIIEISNGAKHRLEILLNPQDSKMLKLIQDGQERPVLDHEELEVIEERLESIEVPAGCFMSTYRRLRNKENGWERETWTSPDIPMNGLLKMIGPTELGLMTFELDHFIWPQN